MEKKVSDTSLLTDLHEALKEHQNTTDTALHQIKDKIESLALQTYCEALRECSDQNTSEIDKLSSLMKEIEVQYQHTIAVIILLLTLSSTALSSREGICF